MHQASNIGYRGLRTCIHTLIRTDMVSRLRFPNDASGLTRSCPRATIDASISDHLDVALETETAISGRDLTKRNSSQFQVSLIVFDCL